MANSIRLLLIAVFAIVPQLTLAVSDLPEGALTVGGVTIGSSEAEVISAFGEPASRPQITEEESLYESKYVYPDATAYFTAGKLELLETSRQGMCTSTGICLGTPAAEVRRKIGCNARDSDPAGGSLSCFDTESACSIVVLLDHGKTAGLRLQCLP